MTDAKRTRRQLDELHAQITRLLSVLPPLVAEQHRNLADGWPTKGDGTGIRSTNAGSTTETAALARLRATQGTDTSTGLDDIHDWLRNATTGLRLLTEWCNDRTPRIDIRDQRCSGGTPSIAAWTRPDCTGIVDHYRLASGQTRKRGDGLCTACRKRKERHDRERPELS